jgi:thermitase
MKNSTVAGALRRALDFVVPGFAMILLAVTVSSIPPGFADDQSSAQGNPKQTTSKPVSSPKPEDLLIVQLTNSADRSEFDSFLQDAHGTVIRTMEFGPTVKFLVVQAESGRAADLEKKLHTCKEIADVERNSSFTLQDSGPNDPYFSSQWGLHFMKYANARSLMLKNAPGRSGEAVIICFLDTGISPSFGSELGNSAAQYDFSGANPTGQREGLYDSDPPVSHGTATASIACSTNNAYGIAGNANVATGNSVYIIELRITSAGSGSTNLANILAGLSFIYNYVPRPVPINCSFGARYPHSLNNTPAIQQAARALWARGSQLVVAAGNDGVADPSKETPYVRRVAAIGQDGKLAYFSEYGPFHGAAPGVNVLSYNPGALASGPGLVSYSGTSLAAPAWTGALALVMRLQSRKSAGNADAIVHLTTTPCSGGWLVPNLEAAARYTLNHQ